VLKSGLAALLTGLAAWGVSTAIQNLLPPIGFPSRLLVVASAGLAGFIIYAGMVRLLGISDVQSFWRQMVRRLPAS
jgi:hypothetical protein